jgi:hypothetical protein
MEPVECLHWIQKRLEVKSDLIDDERDILWAVAECLAKIEAEVE